MTHPLWYEIIGYVASAIVVVSLTMKSVLRLRLIGLVGSVAFLSYGLLIGSIPIVITNGVVMAIHIYFLRRLLGRNEVFEILEVQPNSLYLLRFLEFHRDEIRQFQPGFVYSSDDALRPVFILRDMVPAGLMIARAHPDGSLEIRLDYATPQYRDFKLGRFVYGAESGVFGHPSRVWSEPGNDAHREYLERMGFLEAERDGNAVMERSLGG